LKSFTKLSDRPHLVANGTDAARGILIGLAEVVAEMPLLEPVCIDWFLVAADSAIRKPRGILRYQTTICFTKPD
jgi:hypothetical protein